MIFTIVFFALLVLAGMTFVAWPIWRSHHFRALATEEERERLRREKTQALRLLRDLEFDYSTGKILEGDYALDRAEAERRAIELVKELDAKEAGRPSRPPARPSAEPEAHADPRPVEAELLQSDLPSPAPERIAVSLEVRDARP